MKDNRGAYTELCLQHPEIPIFLQYWWMDASCGDDWNVFFSHDTFGNIRGFLCFHLKKRFGFKAILPQLLTPVQGPWFFYPDDLDDISQAAFEAAVAGDLIAQLNELRVGLYEQAIHFSFQNIAGVIGKGYHSTPRITHRLDPIPPVKDIIAGMPDRKRRQLRSRQYAALKVKVGMEPQVFYDLYEEELENKGEKIFYSYDYFESLYTAAKKHGQGEIIYITDAEDNIHAALWFVWDAVSVYTQVLYINSKYGNSGASLGVIIEAVKYLKGRCTALDFAGSMIPAVAARNKMFGASPMQYYVVSKISNPLLKLWKSFK